MSSEELIQRGYVAADGLRGDPFGLYERLSIGSTSLSALVRCGLTVVLPDKVDYPFVEYKPPKRVGSSKPDEMAIRRDADGLRPVAIVEHKFPSELNNDRKTLKAAEQAIFYGIALGLDVAGFTEGANYWYVDIAKSVKNGRVVYHNDNRPWNPSVLSNLLSGDIETPKDPTPLAETVWQIIWHATKAEPRECLLTFIEIFMLKFLSDNLPSARLANAYRFQQLVSSDEASFLDQHGVTQIEYYVTEIRPRIKQIFPDNVVAGDPDLPKVFGLQTVVSKTSVINGFAFLKTSEEPLKTYNRTFLEILASFEEFGPLTTIEPEFKLRLYETFLRRSARQQKLGQFFTPRNIVQPMIRMAQLQSLPDDATVLDPAAGVGGFILEPLLFKDSLLGNLKFHAGKPKRRVRTIGIDVDPDTHILAKANMLIHLAEAVRSPSTTPQALNEAMADTFVLMNEHGTLGSLFNPPRDSVEVVITNPPYVTQGSAIYRQETANVQGLRNGVELRTYYDTGGLGVESLFLRYIAGALKPGGRAFVIVPLGMLNRSEPKPKRELLKECNVIASIQLPRNAFFNTAQPTYILAIEKRFTTKDRRPDVFCAIARSIGETLDARRLPTPDNNDLEDIAKMFVGFSNGKKAKAKKSPIVKIRPHNDFGELDRWDVPRFWSDDELVALGERPPPVGRIEFVEEAAQSLEDLLTELQEAKAELEYTTPTSTTTVRLGNSELFWLRAGKRITHDELRAHPGDLPVYSCFTKASEEKGRVDERWVKAQEIPIIEKPCVTVNATGASGVGIVFVRENRCVLTDDVLAINPLTDQIDLYYLAAALRTAVAEGNYAYEAKLYKGRASDIMLTIPVDGSGQYDLAKQQAIGLAVLRVETIQERLTELGVWSKATRLT